MKLILSVEPIRPGYDATIRVQYPAEFWDAAQLGSGRLVAQFRSSVPGPLLAELDTDSATLQREADRTLAFVLSEIDTMPMAASTSVVFDVARIEGEDRRAIPGRISWPIKRTVTRK